MSEGLRHITLRFSDYNMFTLHYLMEKDLSLLSNYQVYAFYAAFNLLDKHHPSLYICPCALTEHHAMKVYWDVEV